VISLRTYIREMLKEEGDLQIRVLRAAEQLGKFNASDVTTREIGFLSSAMQGMAVLGNASRSFRASKSGRLKGAFDATKGSRKNVLTAVTGLGVIGYMVNDAFKQKQSSSPVTDADKERLSEALAKFHNDLVKILDDRSNDNITSLRTSNILNQDESSITVDVARSLLPKYKVNFDKHVSDYNKPQTFENNAYDRMFMSTQALQATKAQIASLIDNTTREYAEYDAEGLKYYASCVMYVHYGELIVSALDLDCNTIIGKIPSNESITASFNTYRKNKKAEMESTVPAENLKKAQYVIESIE